MKVLNQYIVVVRDTYQMLFDCGYDTYYITTNGAFGQREMYIERIAAYEAKKLIIEEV